MQSAIDIPQYNNMEPSKNNIESRDFDNFLSNKSFALLALSIPVMILSNTAIAIIQSFEQNSIAQYFALFFPVLCIIITTWSVHAFPSIIISHSAAGMMIFSMVSFCILFAINEANIEVMYEFSYHSE